MSREERLQQLEEFSASFEQLAHESQMYQIGLEQLMYLHQSAVEMQYLMQANPSNEALLNSFHSQIRRINYQQFGLNDLPSMESFSANELSLKQLQLESSLEGIFDKIATTVKNIRNNSKRSKLEKVNKNKFDAAIKIIEGFAEDISKDMQGVTHKDKVEVKLPGSREMFASKGKVEPNKIIGLIKEDRTRCHNTLTVYSAKCLRYIGEAITSFKQADKGDRDFEKAATHVFDLKTPIEEMPASHFDEPGWMQNVMLANPYKQEDYPGLLEPGYNDATKHYVLAILQPALKLIPTTKSVTGPEVASFDKSDLAALAGELKEYAEVLKRAKEYIYKFSDDVMFFAFMQSRVPRGDRDASFVHMAAAAHGIALDASQNTIAAHIGRSTRAVAHLGDDIAKALKK